MSSEEQIIKVLQKETCICIPVEEREADPSELFPICLILFLPCVVAYISQYLLALDLLLYFGTPFPTYSFLSCNSNPRLTLTFTLVTAQ